MLIGGLLLSFTFYLLSRLFFRDRKTLRRLLLGAAVIPFLWVLGVILSVFDPGTFSWFAPYRHVGTYKTTDKTGKPAEVDLYTKSRSNIRPPGTLPRIKLVSSTPEGSDSITVDLGWRFGIGSVRPYRGGIDVFTAYPNGGGLRFSIDGDSIRVSHPSILGPGPRDIHTARESLLPDEYKLVKFLYNVSEIEGGWFNPTSLIQAVNGLFVAGEDRATQALRSYQRMILKRHGGPDIWSQKELDRALLVLRLIFVPKDEGEALPPLSKGLHPLASANTLQKHPSYPIVVFSGIPFLFAPYQGRYAYEGRGEDPVEQLETLLETCEFRKAPIVPATSPLEALKVLLESKTWSNAKKASLHGEWLLESGLRIQALMATEMSAPLSPAEYNALTHNDKEKRDKAWEAKRLEIESMNLQWDEEEQDFVLP